MWLWIYISCVQSSDSQLNDSAEEFGETEEDEVTEEMYSRSIRCRLQEMVVVQESDARSDVYTTSYSWIGNQMNFDGGYLEYNDYGYMVTTASLQQDWQQILTYSYDCDRWCKLLSVGTETISSGNATSYEELYTWDGNTQYLNDEDHHTYNEYGYIVESYTQRNGVETQIGYTYNCQDWCRLQSMVTTTTSEVDTQEIVEEYEWTDNMMNRSDGYDLFNEYGYVTETYTEGLSATTLTQFLYQCDS